MGSPCWKTELREATSPGTSAVPSMLAEFLQGEPRRTFRYDLKFMWKRFNFENICSKGQLKHMNILSRCVALNKTVTSYSAVYINYKTQI